MIFFYVQPEVAGATISDPAQSASCVVDTWLGDDLVRAQPLLLVTTPLKNALGRLDQPSGFDLAPVRIRSSPYFRRYNAGKRLPRFWSLQPSGTPGRDDVGVAADGSLVVSQRVLDVLMEFRVARAVFAQHSKGARARRS
jgi:hypothetical protein